MNNHEGSTLTQPVEKLFPHICPVRLPQEEGCFRYLTPHK